MRFVFLATFLLFSFFIASTPVSAYTNNPSATMILGQSNFTSATTGTSATTFNGPRGVTICNGKLILADLSNHRVLIWNSIPTVSNTPADVVIGQPNFTSNTANNGGVSARSLRGPFGSTCIGSKLIIADMENNRVLIFNTIPTQNFQPADYVIGQSSFSTATANVGGTPTATNLFRPHGVTSIGTKLAVLDTDNRRALIFNSVPESNFAAANLVLGQPNFTSRDIICSASGFDHEAIGIHSAGGKLVISQSFLTSLGAGGQRVLVWNSIPTQNNQAADTVLGQTSSTNCSTVQPVSANAINRPFGVHIDSKNRLFISDRGNARVLVYTNFPSRYFAPADFVIGQPNFTSNAINQGMSSPGQNTISGTSFITTTQDKIIISDSSNHRVLFYDSAPQKAGLILEGNTLSEDKGIVSIRGNVNSSSTYPVFKVEYSVNGGGWKNATATDSSFNSLSEKFIIQFNKSDENYSKDGYTIRVRAYNSNNDVTDESIIASYFKLESPGDHQYFDQDIISFQFAFPKERIAEILNVVTGYEIEIQKDNGAWNVYANNIPSLPSSPDIDGNISFENSAHRIVYSDNGARVNVTPKDTIGGFYPEGFKLNKGIYKFRVAAISKGGHKQYTGEKTVKIRQKGYISSDFPISILSPFFISSTYPDGWIHTRSIVTATPVFYGIANVGSTVTAKFTKSKCEGNDCSFVLSSQTNEESRFGINVPAGLLDSGSSYSVSFSAEKDTSYAELPEMTVSVNTY